MKGMATGNKIHCKTEYAGLNRVIVVKPSFMKITQIINETQKHYKDSNIDISLALQQHEAFIHVLKDHGIEVIELSTDPNLHEQVFTRDTGFTINNQLFIASMSEPVRQDETAILKTCLRHHSIPFREGLPASIEGGDVLIDRSTIWVGNSGRTSPQAIKELQARLPSHHIEPLTLKDDILHLDCVFNIIGQSTALVYPPAFTPNGWKRIQSRFEDLIEVTKEEQFQMGPNVLSIGNGKVISLSQNERLNEVMQSKGFQVIPVDFSEIIKSGGSFRCCTLPLQRK